MFISEKMRVCVRILAHAITVARYRALRLVFTSDLHAAEASEPHLRADTWALEHGRERRRESC